MPRSIRTYLIIFSIVAMLVCYALFIYYPAFPKSILGWFALILVGLPLLFFFEWLGEVTLGSVFFNRLSSGMRITLGVPVFVALMALVLWLASIAMHLINL